MRRSPVPLYALVILASSIIASCASSGPTPTPKPGPTPSPTAQRVQKQRTVMVKVPVVVKESSYYADGLLDGYTVYKYDSANKNLLEKDTFDSSRADPMERVVSEWKGALLVDDVVYDKDNKVKLRHDYGYDAAGRLVSDKVSDSNGLPTSASAYAYDAQGNKIEWRALDGAGILKAITTYSYGKPDASGSSPLQLISLKDASGTVTGSIKLTYDSTGRLVRRDYLAADGSSQKSEVYAYASAADKSPSALETRRADGSLSAKTVYQNGDLGQVLKATDTTGSGSVRGFKQYEYVIREDAVIQVYYE